MLSMSRFFWSFAFLVASLGGVAAHASLFDDDEARRAILDLRQKLEIQKSGLESAQNEIKALGQENAQLRTALLDLQSHIDKLQQEIAQVNGDKDLMARQLSQTQMMIKDQAQVIENRLAKFEPQKVSMDGVEFTAEPSEMRDFDSALALFKKADYAGAVLAFTDFARHYPSSGFSALALYWLGTAQYASRDFKSALQTFKALANMAPNHPKVPDSELLSASCQVELKDTKGARKTLEDLIKTYPQSDAAQTARERLTKLK
jgi:tol-pal system protein YbgF